jgi:hypothetical protein
LLYEDPQALHVQVHPKQKERQAGIGQCFYFQFELMDKLECVSVVNGKIISFGVKY